MNIIAMNGYKRSGKGETANAVEGLVDGLVKQVGFADKLKILGARSLGFVDRTDQECIDLMDIAKDHWLIDVTREGSVDPFFPTMPMANITGRQYLQWMGTEARKIFGSDFWVDQVLPTPAGSIYDPGALDDMHPSTDWLLITDLRFENEAQRVLDLGGVVWRIHHPATESDGHDSEQTLPDSLVTWEIHNDGTLVDLADKADEALAETLGW